ncbi:MAG: hypothetical protein U1D70_17120 [Methylobacter sp.]|nr:hypothetical protein [Methylobacter sp.]
MLLEGTYDAPFLDIFGGPDGDTITLRPVAITGETRIAGGGGSDRIMLDVLPTLALPVYVDGEGGSDLTIINTTGASDYRVYLTDTGADGDGTDIAIINGTALADTFFVRANFVSSMQTVGDPVDLVFASTYERIDYTGAIEGIDINALASADRFFVDDTGTSFLLTGGLGDDSFQFGQLYGSDRAVPFVAAGDEIATVETTAGFLSRGTSDPSIAIGGPGDDSFTVYSNQALLALLGLDGNDSFTVRAFLVKRVDEVVEYTVNAPLIIGGGNGTDLMTVVGTAANDNIALDDMSIQGMGLGMLFANIERVDVDAEGGDDHFFVLGTTPTVLTTVIGGTGSDTVDVAGDVTAPVASAGPQGLPQPPAWFDAQPQTASAIAGPLLVEGDRIREYTLARAAMLPTESDTVLPAQPAPSEDASSTDFLNIYDAGSTAGLSGGLGLISETATSAVAAAIGTPTVEFDRSMFGNVYGLGMGGASAFDFGTSSVPDLLLVDGGVTFHDMEIANVLMGRGDDTFTVHTTIPDMITLIQGGGGSDTITVLGGGGNTSPLIVFGDTSQDGHFYNSSADAYLAYAMGGYLGDAGLNGIGFDNPGDDVIDASVLGVPIAIYGGPGVDFIFGGSGEDHLAGGSGADGIWAGSGNDHIYGDDGFNVDLGTKLGQNPQILFVVSAPASTDHLTTRDPLTAGVDTIYGGDGEDIIFGDHGRIDQVAGTQRIFTTGYVVSAQTTEPASSMNDYVFAGAGNDLIFGGGGDDELHGEDGNDLIFGDFGMVSGDVTMTALPLATLTPAFTFFSIDTTHAAGGNDSIWGGSGDDLLMGQQGSDTILGENGDDDLWGGHNVAGGFDAGDVLDGGAGADVIAGDNAVILRTGGSLSPRMRSFTGAPVYDLAGNVVVGAVALADPSGWSGRTIILLDHSLLTTPGTWGNDTIAGGAGDDHLFGQLGDDHIQGDGSVTVVADAWRNADGSLSIIPAIESASDGDDYIEGGGGDDTIFGGLGQDDIVGGSSSLFGLTSPDMRPDGSDIIFGGSGARTARGYVLTGDGLIAVEDAHAADADTIAGDNANIFRLVQDDGSGGTSYLTYGYDASSDSRFFPEVRGDLRIVPRVVGLLDYTPGGPDLVPGSLLTDVGDGDEIHGESGDDTIYGMSGDDVLFGDSDNDDLIGGWGHDWISGGTGNDGVLGDDGRISTSRNGIAEPIYGLAAKPAGGLDRRATARTPDGLLSAAFNVTGEIVKTVNLTPFNPDPSSPNEAERDFFFDPAYADDIIYGGLGDDWLHGGAGDDAISGAEALAYYYDRPNNPGDVLGYDPETRTFPAWNQRYPGREIFVDANGNVDYDSDIPFLLNFDAFEGGSPVAPAWRMVTYLEGNDRIFGGLGNDWLVGGPGADHLYGGWGDDVMNADDIQSDSTVPEVSSVYADIVYGGEGRDILVGGSGRDQLIDRAGEPNRYYGGTAVAEMDKDIRRFLLMLSAGDGADPTRAIDAQGNAWRNGEPNAELGITVWYDPAKPFAGEIQPAELTVLVPKVVRTGRRVKVSGSLMASSGFRLEGRRVQLEVSVDGVSWRVVAVTLTDGNGGFVMPLPAISRASYVRVSFLGDDQYMPAYSEPLLIRAADDAAVRPVLFQVGRGVSIVGPTY